MLQNLLANYMQSLQQQQQQQQQQQLPHALLNQLHMAGIPLPTKLPVDTRKEMNFPEKSKHISNLGKD